VATNYVQMRTTEQRIKYARENVALQRRTTGFLDVREKGGTINKVGLLQAQSLLYQTEAGIHELEISLRQFNNQLCILLGIHPEKLQANIGKKDIPEAPAEVAVGIPADLLRRRPDIRRAERQAAAQCAQIGVAESDLYPHITLIGTLDWSAAQFPNL